MPDSSAIGQIRASFESLGTSLSGNLPNILTAIGIFFLGLIIAYFARLFITRLVRKSTRLFRAQRLQGVVSDESLERHGRILGRLTYWFVVAFFLTVATEIIGLPIVTTWLGGITEYLPNVVVAALIILIGSIGGSVVRDLIATSSESAGVTRGAILGRICEIIIVMVSIVIGIDQLGIDIQFLTVILGIAVGGLVIGAALAFALGARDDRIEHFSPRITFSRKLSGRDKRIKIGDIEGMILEISSTKRGDR